MRSSKERLTVTVDAELIASGHRSVAAGGARSLSSWVNQALRERVAREERLRAMTEALATYEAEHGVISLKEIAEQQRLDARDALVVRGRRRRRSRAGHARRGAA